MTLQGSTLNPVGAYLTLQGSRDEYVNELVKPNSETVISTDEASAHFFNDELFDEEISKLRGLANKGKGTDWDQIGSRLSPSSMFMDFTEPGCAQKGSRAGLIGRAPTKGFIGEFFIFFSRIVSGILEPNRNQMGPYRPQMNPYWAQMGTYGPTWAHMGPYGPKRVLY